MDAATPSIRIARSRRESNGGAEQMNSIQILVPQLSEPKAEDAEVPGESMDSPVESAFSRSGGARECSGLIRPDASRSAVGVARKARSAGGATIRLMSLAVLALLAGCEDATPKPPPQQPHVSATSERVPESISILVIEGHQYIYTYDWHREGYSGGVGTTMVHSASCIACKGPEAVEGAKVK